VSPLPNRRPFIAAAIFFLVVASGVACSSGGGNPGNEPDGGGADAGGLADAGAGTLALSPSNALLFIVYGGVLTRPDGSTKDATAELVLAVDNPAVGTFAGVTFKTATALPDGARMVSTLVHGTAEGASGTANLTVFALASSGASPETLFQMPYTLPPVPASAHAKAGGGFTGTDVVFLVDGSGAMAGHVNLKELLAGTIVPQLVAALPSVAFAVAYEDDFPVSPYGTPACGTALVGDLPIGVVQPMSTDVTAVQAALRKLELHCGYDAYGAEVPAMSYLLGGQALPWPGGSVPAHSGPAGTFGGADFRDGAFHVLVLANYSPWHNVSATDAYSFAAPSLTGLEAQFAATGARFVNIIETATATADTYTDAQTLSAATKSYVSPAAVAGAGNCPFDLSGASRAPDGPGGSCSAIFKVSNGTGLAPKFTAAIQALATAPLDVKAQVSNDASNPGGLDATLFIQSVAALTAGDAALGCAAISAKDTNGDGIADTFVSVPGGTQVCFDVTAKSNMSVPQATGPVLLTANLDLVGEPGNVSLGHRKILFLVPAKN